MRNLLIGMVVAMPEEAQPIIDGLGLQKMREHVWMGLYGGTTVRLQVSGIGKINAMNAARDLIEYGADYIINVGTAGDCGNHEIGTAIYPNVFYDGDFDLSPIGNPTKDPANVNIFKVAKPEVCYSFSQFVTDSRCKGAIVEMEAYAIAAACVNKGVPFFAIKVISDKADSNAEESFDNSIQDSVIAKVMPEIKKTIERIDEYMDLIYGPEV